MRDFVMSHPDYKHDSVVSDVINFDLMKECEQITLGTKHAPDLLPCHNTKTADNIPSALEKAENYESSLKASKKNGSVKNSGSK